MNTKYRQQINWYLSLAYLHVGSRDEAILVLNKIQQGEHQYDQSRKLLDELD